MRRISYVSGSRADFGLMASTLQLASSTLDVSICATGMHLSESYGNTVQDIEATGLRVCARIPVALEEQTGAAMAVALGHELIGMTAVFQRERPDLVVVLGDRGEMLAAALAAIHLNIPIVHIHGGERSGTVDEPIRHAISKLAHYHFVATEGARQRLIRMGERESHIYITGAPGLDGLKSSVCRSRAELCAEQDLSAVRPVALVVFHPVLQQASLAGEQMRALMQGVIDADVQALCLMPNADAGSTYIRDVLAEFQLHPDVRLATHLRRSDFVSWMGAADVMVGNSSSGIIEAASLGLPVINVGDRQAERERSGNVIDAPSDAKVIKSAVREALNAPRREWINVYGDGAAGDRIVDLLTSLPLTPQLLMKTNAY